MKQKMALTVRGKQHEYAFTVYAEPSCLPDYHADGLQIYQLEYEVPDWVVNLGLIGVYCFAVDVLSFRNPWRK